MAANGISTLAIPIGITATSYTQASSYLVAVGTFNYDAYGNGFAIRKDGGAIDAYMTQVIALGAGARNWTFVPANGQPSFTRSMSQPDGTNESNDPGETGVDIWNVATANSLVLAGAGAGQLNTSLIPNGTSFIIYATELGNNSGLADKEARQIAKLTIAEAKRQGKIVAVDGTITGSIDNTKSYYRTNNEYDITQLPTQYDNNAVINNPNESRLIEGRPWAASQVYTNLIFTYGEAKINFTLASGIFYNVTCPDGAGGYPYGGAVDPVITMPGNQLTGGTTPANDIQWEYTVDVPGGAITGFTYRSGNPP